MLIQTLEPGSEGCDRSVLGYLKKRHGTTPVSLTICQADPDHRVVVVKDVTGIVLYSSVYSYDHL